jgi:hypothetical protein
MIGDFIMCQNTINQIITEADENSWKDLIYSLYRFLFKLRFQSFKEMTIYE